LSLLASIMSLVTVLGIVVILAVVRDYVVRDVKGKIRVTTVSTMTSSQIEPKTGKR
jgi:hypothetical protein